MKIISSNIYIIKHKSPVGSRRNEDAKYIEGGGDDHLTEFWYHIIMEMSSSKDHMEDK